MIICEKLKKLFRKEEKSPVNEGLVNQPLDYLKVTFSDIQKDKINANKIMSENIKTLMRKLPKLTKEELETELKGVRRVMNTEELRMIRNFFPQDVFAFIQGHLKSYRDEIEKELKNR